MFKNLLLKIGWGVLLSLSLLVAQIPTKSNVTELYVATFKRAPDASGLQYWVEESGLTLEQIAKSFFDQPETKSLYPDGYSNHNFVEAVYQNLFDREPDIDGWQYWEDELDNGNIPRSTFILAAINGAMGDDAILLNNKKEIGEYFANAGLNDTQEAYRVISMVDITQESINKVKEYINNIKSDNNLPKPSQNLSDWSDLESKALEYLNQIRQELGMKPFNPESHLHTAAFNHAKYLILNSESGHYESEGKSGFTGKTPPDRAIVAGYPINNVTENYSSPKDYKSNVDELFTAIYHRLGFLDFSRDEIGIGADISDNNSAYIYDMGNSSLRKFCERGESQAGDGYYYLICTNSDIKISEEKFYSYSNTEPNVDYVVYPKGIINKGLFNSEIPYPIPGYSFSGNPISIFFNPYNVDCSSIVMDSFSVTDLTTGKSMTPITIMNKDNDPNSRFSGCDFAFFPSEREEFGHTYQAIFEYDDGSGNHSVEWQFSISTPGGDISHILTANESNNRFTINRGEDYYIYVPPTESQPTIGSLNYSYDYPTLETFEWYDQNTIHIKVSSDSQKGYIDISIDDRDVYLDVE